MMKKSILAAAVLAFSATAAQAQDVSGYLQGNLGHAKAKTPDILKDVGLKFTDSTDLSYKMIVGLKLNSYFALEAQYVDLGASKFEIPALLTLKNKNRGVGGNVVAMLPVQETGLNVFAKAGMHRIKTKTTLSVNKDVAIAAGIPSKVSDSTTETVKSFAFGAFYDVTPELSIVAEHEQYRKVGDLSGYNIGVSSVGLRYNF